MPLPSLRRMEIMSKHYPVEQRERAVRMVLDHLDEYRSVYAACQAIGPKLGLVRSRCAGRCCRLRSTPVRVLASRPSSSSGSGILSARSEISRRPEILKAASIFFTRELDPRHADLRFHRRDACTNFRVESVCRVLIEHGVQVAPRTYRSWKSSMPSARTVSDARLTDALPATVAPRRACTGGGR